MTKEALKPVDDERETGRPPHQPSDLQRQRVTVLAEAGVPQQSIANDLGISKNTLKKHYARELIMADVKVKGMLGQTSLRLALGAPAEYYPQEFDNDGRALPPRLKRAEVLPEKTVLIFLCKTRLGLIERLALTDEKFDQEAAEFDTIGLTESERGARIMAIYERARARGGQGAARNARRVGTVSGKPAGSRARKRS